MLAFIKSCGYIIFKYIFIKMKNDSSFYKSQSFMKSSFPHLAMSLVVETLDFAFDMLPFFLFLNIDVKLCSDFVL